jgi:HSP20 family protein
MRGGLIRLEDHITTEYTVRAELPGLNLETDVQVSVSHAVLTIHAERKEHSEAGHRTEFRHGGLQRSVLLPSTADEEGVKAHSTKGILEIPSPGRSRSPLQRSETCVERGRRT